MKKWSMFLAAAACACVLASPLQAAERKKVNISFPTAATTGALYPLGAGIANLWNTKLGYVNARVQASNGGIQNLNLLKAGNAQVSFAVSSITYEALNGERGFKDRAYKDVRVLALAAGLQGWLFGPCNSVMRGLLLVAAFLAIDPGLKTDLAALALCAVAGVWSWKERGKG